MEHEANWSLEGDGLVENLFYYLWCKDEFGGGPSLLIPDTIVYKFTQPAYWYFTSKTGNVQIEKEFCRKSCGVDIVGYYIYILNDIPTIEYFNVDGLKEFLYTRQKVHNGILQRFIVPKGSSNSMIRAIWTPKMCLLERKTNIRRLHDLRYGIYERAMTFDGADAYSNPDPVRGSILPGDIQYLCEQVVDHVMEVSFHKYRISRMVLHMKTDADDNVWLCWSSSIRLAHCVDGNRPLDITCDAQVPSFVHLNCMGDGKPSGNKPKVFFKCNSCAKSIDASFAAQVPYKAILEHFRQLLEHIKQAMLLRPRNEVILWPPDPSLLQAAGGIGFGILKEIESTSSTGKAITELGLTIPPVLRYLHPHLNLGDFKRYVHDPVFLYKTASVCDDCFLVYADYTTASLEVNTVRQEAPAILRPQREIPPLKQDEKKIPPNAWLPPTKRKSKRIPKTTGKSQYQFKEPPALPQRIDQSLFEEVDRQLPFELRMSASAPTLSVKAAEKDPYFPEEWKQTPTMVANPIGAIDTVSKEDHFFTELSSTSMTLEQHHPLRHMIDSSSQFELTRGNDVVPAKKMKNPYKVVQQLRDEALKKKKKQENGMQRVIKTKVELKHLIPSEEERTTSMQHREFLLKSLHEIRQQINQSEPLADVLKIDDPARKTAKSIPVNIPSIKEDEGHTPRSQRTPRATPRAQENNSTKEIVTEGKFEAEIETKRLDVQEEETKTHESAIDGETSSRPTTRAESNEQSLSFTNSVMGMENISLQDNLHGGHSVDQVEENSSDDIDGDESQDPYASTSPWHEEESSSIPKENIYEHNEDMSMTNLSLEKDTASHSHVPDVATSEDIIHDEASDLHNEEEIFPPQDEPVLDDSVHL